MPSDAFNVIGLISGGKDSLFSLLHCLANGHNIVALANVYAADDAESYMYQTVGHQIIPLYAQALRLPLYREPIRGGPADLRLHYKPPASDVQDETESMLSLLLKAKKAHPEANAVSTGAILSTYQRTRVESVALRLGLVPLSFLWQFPYLPPYRQSSLLEDMLAAGQRSIIVKVASGGLGVEFLGQDVSDLRVVSRLLSAMARFGSHEVGNVLGEGGEYETLAEDGPWPLWKGEIVQLKQKVVTGNTSSILETSGGVVTPKLPPEKPITPRKPDLLDSEFLELLHELKVSKCEVRRPLAAKRFNRVNMLIKECPGELVKISNIHCAQPGLNAAEQMRNIVSTLRILLKRWIAQPSFIVFSMITLREMADFGAVNVAYGLLFDEPNPPARATIACELFEGVDVVLSVVVDLNATSKRSLHVQSRSYWAPANIGPYSQAISVAQKRSSQEVVYVAGQIPLVPSSMEIVLVEQCPKGYKLFDLQAVVALQHLWRIGRSMKVSWWTGAIAFVDAPNRAATTFRVWEDIHSKQNQNDESEEPDFDVWHARHDFGFLPSTTGAVTRSPLPDWSCCRHPAHTPPIFTVQVQELPRRASIEWLSVGISTIVGIEQRSEGAMQFCRVLPHGPIVSFIGFSKASSIATCGELLLTLIDDEWTHFFTVYVVTSDIPWHWVERERAEVHFVSGIWQDAECELEALVVVQSRNRGAETL